MMATSLVSRLALRGLGSLGGLGGRLVAARSLHASAVVPGKHVWYPDIDWVGALQALKNQNHLNRDGKMSLLVLFSFPYKSYTTGAKTDGQIGHSRGPVTERQEEAKE